MGYLPESCDVAGICSVQYVLESDGSIYFFDFYGDASYLENFHPDDCITLDERQTELHFIEDSPNSIDACPSCLWRDNYTRSKTI